MKIQGEHHFKAPRDRVWRTVLDPKALGAAVPGLQRLDPIGDTEYEGALEIQVGPVEADFQGTLELSDLKAPSSYRFKLNGMGGAGFVDGEGLLVLEESKGGTLLHYDLDARLGGRISGVGQPLLDSSAKVLARQTLEGIERLLAPPDKPAVSPARQSEAPPAAPERSHGTPPSSAASDRPAASRPTVSQPAGQSPSPRPNPMATARTARASDRAGLALGFLKGFSGNLLASSRGPWVVGAALVVYTLLVIALTRACSG